MNNLLSLFLGLMAWALPIMYLMTCKRRTLFCCGSLTACAAALYFQLREILRRTVLADFSAIMDTIGAVVFAASALLVITLLLNTLALLRKEA